MKKRIGVKQGNRKILKTKKIEVHSNSEKIFDINVRIIIPENDLKKILLVAAHIGCVYSGVM